MAITDSEYLTLSEAYRVFNEALFEGNLPEVLITLQRKGRTRGYFSPDRFENRRSDDVASELALNPDRFQDRTDKEILSTLVHEQVHVWQHALGKPSRNGYHNREWADKMISIGLIPSDTGQPGGRQTGSRVTHYIQPGGPFETVCDALLADGLKLQWASKGRERAAPQSKVRYTCPLCELNLWGRPEAPCICGACFVPLLDPHGDHYVDMPGWERDRPRRRRPAARVAYMEDLDALRDAVIAARVRMQRAHPDHGGSESEFITARKEYETAKAAYEQAKARQAAA